MLRQCWLLGPLHLTGAMTALVDAATRWAGEHQVPVEASPIDPAVDSATGNRFPNVLPVFLRAGFTETGRLAPDRPAVQKAPS